MAEAVEGIESAGIINRASISVSQPAKNSSITITFDTPFNTTNYYYAIRSITRVATSSLLVEDAMRAHTPIGDYNGISGSYITIVSFSTTGVNFRTGDNSMTKNYNITVLARDK